MKNIINYYYNLNIFNIFEIKNGYYFNINNNSFIFISYDRFLEECQSIYNLYTELLKRKIFTNDIILNKEHQILTMVNNTPYVLIKDNTISKSINMNDILYLQNNSLNISNDKLLLRNNWISLWELKIDYYESKINEINNKSILCSTLNYYIGLGENGISYLVNNDIKLNDVVLSHKRIKVEDSSFEFYTPTNYILDSRVRDFTEYVKDLFFRNMMNFDMFESYLNLLNFNRDEYILLISRLLYPSYYFDLFDEIVSNNKDESIIKNVINKNRDYILFLKNTFYYIIYKKRISIPVIEWIINY